MAKKVFKSLTTCMMETIHILDDLSGKLQMERILHNITQKLYEKTNCQTCAIIRFQTGNERLEIANSQGLSWQFCKMYRQNKVDPLIQDFLWQESPKSIPDVSLDEPAVSVFQLEHPFKSCYCIPLQTNKKPAGYLYLDSAEADHFTPDDMLLAQLYAKIISVTLLKDNLQAALEKRQERNKETGSILYDIFYRRLGEALAKAERQGEKLSAILMDIVKFDQILTAYGDEVCQKLLKELSMTVNGSLRTYDAISRFGADELIISLPGHSVGEATACTRKLHELIRQKTFTDKKLHIDVSIGVAAFPDHARTPAGLVTALKNALVESKRSPEHKICVAGEFFE